MGNKNSSPFSVNSLPFSGLEVTHSSLKKSLAIPRKVELSEIFEIPCQRMWLIAGDIPCILRIRFGIVVGHQHFKLVVFFVDYPDENFDIDDLSGTEFKVDTLEGKRCYSYIYIKDKVRDGFWLCFNRLEIDFDTDKPIRRLNQYQNDKLTINSRSIRMNSLNPYESGVGLDVDIVIGGRIIRASKYSLAHHSPVFAAMFSTNRHGSITNIVELTDDFETMNHLIKTIHGVLCEVDVTMALAMSVVADKYDMSEVLREIEDYVKPMINTQNVIQVIRVADMFNLKGMKSNALDFIRLGPTQKLSDLDDISNASIRIMSMIAETLNSEVRSVVCTCRKLT